VLGVIPNGCWPARVFDLGDDGKPAPALFLSFEMLPYFITHLMGHIHQYPSTGS